MKSFWRFYSLKWKLNFSPNCICILILAFLMNFVNLFFFFLIIFLLLYVCPEFDSLGFWGLLAFWSFFQLPLVFARYITIIMKISASNLKETNKHTLLLSSPLLPFPPNILESPLILYHSVSYFRMRIALWLKSPSQYMVSLPMEMGLELDDL